MELINHIVGTLLVCSTHLTYIQILEIFYLWSVFRMRWKAFLNLQQKGSTIQA